jgi:hypothetical protein
MRCSSASILKTSKTSCALVRAGHHAGPSLTRGSTGALAPFRGRVAIATRFGFKFDPEMGKQRQSAPEVKRARSIGERRHAGAARAATED